jgi:hypothetical protein
VEVAGTGSPDGNEAPEKNAVAAEKPARAKKAGVEEKPYWQQHLEEGSADRSRTAAALIVTIIVVIVVLSAVLVIYLVRPQPRTVYSELAVGQYDVTYSASTPSGDNRSALVPVEIKITNKGEGESGVVKVYCDAYNFSNQNQKASGFNTSELQDINGNLSDKIPPKGKPGCIVHVDGVLNLTPGQYIVRLDIYEDAKQRTLVSGSFIVNVDQSMVATPQSYVPEQGSGRGKSTDLPPASSGGFTPGFEGPAALAAVAAVLILVRLDRKRC